MQLLSIETSGRKGGFAIVDETGVVCEIFTDMQGAHVEKGSKLIEMIMETASVSVQDIDAVAVSLGPGSFTGLRVGLALAKGICFAARKQLAGVPTLDSVAEMVRMCDSVLVPMLDARRGEIYFSIYRSSHGKMQRIADYLALEPSQAACMIRDVADGEPILVLGDALARYGDLLRKELPSSCIFAPTDFWSPRPGVIGEIGIRMLRNGETLDVDTAQPLYVRPSEAERNLRRQKHGGN